MHGKSRVLSIGVLATAVLCCDTGVEAQVARGLPALPAQVSDLREIEAFRGDLGRYIEGMKGVADAAGLPSSELDVALRGLPRATIADLRILRAAFARSPGWRTHPQTLRGLVRLRPKGAPLRLAGVGPRITTDDCPTAINAGFTQTDIEIATDVALAADVILEAIPNDVLGAIARAVAVGIWAIPQGVLRGFSHLYNIAQVCQSETFETGVNTQLTNIFNNDNANRALIINNDNSNRALIVANDNTNTTSILTAIADLKAKGDANTAAILDRIASAETAIIENDNANKTELRDLMLRTQIEADLAEADSATPVALYVTPDANGGHLDLVRDIVAETIANVLAAGGNVGQAEAFLAQGDAARAGGDFDAAYKSYRKAYKAAVQ